MIRPAFAYWHLLASHAFCAGHNKAYQVYIDFEITGITMYRCSYGQKEWAVARDYPELLQRYY